MKSSDIASEDCLDNRDHFKNLDKNSREEYLKAIWHRAFLKAKAGAISL